MKKDFLVPHLKIVLLLSLTILYCNSSIFSQTKLIDSLSLEIENSPIPKPIDTVYAQLQHDLATAFSKTEKAVDAIHHDQLALLYAGNNLELLFQIHNSLGGYYLDVDNFVESLTEFKKALEYAIQMNDQIKIGIVHYNLSTHYDRTANDSLSYEHLQIAYDLMIEAGDTVKTIYLLNSLGTFEVVKKQIVQAKNRFEEALSLSLLTGDSTLISNSYNNFANYYLTTKDTLQALEYLKKSYEIDKINGTEENKAIVTYNIATMYSITNKLDSALVYIDLAKESALKTNRISLLEPIYNTVFDLNFQAKKYDSLPGIFDEYQTISDSLLSRQNIKQYAEAQSEIELITTQQKNAILEINDKASQQRFTYLAVVTVLLLLILIGSMMAINRIKTQKLIAESLHKQTKQQNTKIEIQQAELVQKNSQLENNALYKDRIMSLLAHDLRTPFASIHSLNHLVTESGELNERQTEFLGTSNKVIESGLDLISDILHIYKLENIEDFDFELLNISQLLTSSAEKLRPITTVKKQNLVLDFEPNIEFIINREMLQSAIDNLLSNASKYSNSNKTITMKMMVKDEKLIINIIDEGVGFSTEEQKILFDRFNKFTRTTLTGESSTGLGLFLVKGFVEKLGGEITLQSTVDTGSTFTLIFENKSHQ